MLDGVYNDISALPSVLIQNKEELPSITGIYFVINKENNIIYIGRASNIRQRWGHHHRIHQLERLIDSRIAWVEIEDTTCIEQLELSLIRHFRPTFNWSEIPPRNYQRRQRKREILTGMRFNHFLVIGESESSVSKNRRWDCLCDCGRVISVYSGDLKRGKSRNCGCVRDALNNRPRTHGHAGKSGYSRTYNIWRCMKARCTNPNNTSYRIYGGRGISICDRWLSFEVFLQDMGECPDGYQIDRIDVNGNYCPENCRWASRKEQAINRRTTKLFLFQGKLSTIEEIAEALDMSVGTLRSRLGHLGWDLEKAINKPVTRKSPKRFK